MKLNVPTRTINRYCKTRRKFKSCGEATDGLARILYSFCITTNVSYFLSFRLEKQKVFFSRKFFGHQNVTFSTGSEVASVTKGSQFDPCQTFNHCLHHAVGNKMLNSQHGREWKTVNIYFFECSTLAVLSPVFHA